MANNIKTVLAPTVHIGGTHRDDLLGDLGNAIRSLRDSVGFLKATAPHPRDYYHDASAQASFAIAQHQYLNRIKKLNDVTAELRAIERAIYDGDTSTVAILKKSALS